MLSLFLFLSFLSFDRLVEGGVVKSHRGKSSGIKSPMVVQVPGATISAVVIWMHGNMNVLIIILKTQQNSPPSLPLYLIAGSSKQLQF